MKTLYLVALLAVSTLAPANGSPLDDALNEFSARFQAAQPSDEQQAIWKLDWEDNLTTALDRAKRERRPILFVHVTNITGPSNFGSGHC